ncbi:unnamed protein product [Echinostoma caproni]|uniref:IRS-type PTB domain-containing protein n=1 Tax=Echinostoma caproni TaxID=27848 RepID=A0A183ARI0_9TREM|nr:unnamed protein product [Echinostoma caproni]
MGLSPSSLRSESLQCLVSDPEYLVHAVDQHRFQVASARDNLNIKLSCTQLTDSPVLSNTDERLCLCTASLLDCRLRLVCKGQLELRTSDLLFRDASYVLTWPLGSLRWYATDAKHFVFESGRRSPSGPGLFVFKCKHSKKLGLKLSMQIHRLLSHRSDSAQSHRQRYTTRPSINDEQPVKLVFQTEHPSPTRIHSITPTSPSVPGEFLPFLEFLLASNVE